ncbi:S41 family peptidase, partial [Vibrio sp. 99-70-13A1]|uniref:S41 family peptidase n=1 Tax=Vibrio sp. 99-70-13A1 TaxID=2607601 RepID=UPI001493A4C7
PIQCLAISKFNINNWEYDVDFYLKTMSENHIDLHHTISKHEFHNEIIKIKSQLSNLTKNELLVELMKLTKKIDDGHTSFPLWGVSMNYFPIQLRMFDGELYVVKTTNDYKNLLGSRLGKINNISSKEVYRLFSKLAPFSENKYSTEVRTSQYIPMAELLNGLGIINDTFRAQFTFIAENEIIEDILEASHSNDFSAELSYLNSSIFTIEEKLNEDLWFGSLDNKNIVYFKFRRYTSATKMESLGEGLLNFIYKNKSRKLIIDLRDNYGGDFFIGLILAQFIVLADSIDWKSGVYVLIDNVTFSAAMSNAVQFSQLLNAQLVGEPTGSKPSGYQDMGQFTLPNSSFKVTYSKRLFQFNKDNKDALYPDVKIKISIDDYISNNDPQLNWILNDINSQ